MTGPAAPVAWNAPARQTDFFDLKGVVDEVLAAVQHPARVRVGQGRGVPSRALRQARSAL